MSGKTAQFTIETMGESCGHCDCCGNESRSIWGLVNQGEATQAAYWLHWTVGHLSNPGANLDMVLGRWGDGATSADRVMVSMLYRVQSDGSAAFMVIDAAERAASKSGLAETALAREDVVGTPLATQTFALVDAIIEQDGRFS